VPISLNTLFPLRAVPIARGGAVRFSWLLFALFFAVCVAVNYPGRLNSDSLQQILGMRDLRFLSDLHSPPTAAIWSLFAPLVGQPASALLVQSALLAFFVGMVPRPDRWGWPEAAAAALETLFKLSLVLSAGFIIKDMLLVGLLLAGLAALYRASTELTRPELSRPWLIAAAVCFAVSLLVRPSNFVMLTVAAILVLPLLVASWRGWLVASVAFAAVFALSVPVYGGINRLLGAKPGHAEIQLFLFDSAGISARTGRNLFDPLEGWPRGLPDPRACYTPSEAAVMAPWAQCRGYARAGVRLYSADRSKVIGWWLRNVASHPVAYAQHRLAFTGHLVDPLESARRHPVYSAALRGTRHHLYALNDGQRPDAFSALTKSKPAASEIGWWRSNPVAEALGRYGSGVYEQRWNEALALLFSLGLLLWQWRRRAMGRPVHLAVAVAAGLCVGNVAMHGVLGVASQSRYLFPSVCCAIYALLLLLWSRAAATAAVAGTDA
jgi:hypothetical protein